MDRCIYCTIAQNALLILDKHCIQLYPKCFSKHTRIVRNSKELKEKPEKLLLPFPFVSKQPTSQTEM